MAISYTEAVKLKTTEAVFARGIKYYLFQKVKNKQELLLPNWREYEVKGEKQVYIVRYPVIHKLTSVTSNEQLAQIIETHASCNCQYFLDYGLCKHIVSVSSEIDNEFFDPKKDFKLKSDAKEIAKLQKESLLDNIFGIERDKKISQFIDYLFKANTPSYLTREMVLDIEKEFQESLESLDKILSSGPIADLNLIRETIESNPKQFILSIKILNEIQPKIGFYKEEKDIYTLLEKSVYFWKNQSFLYLILCFLVDLTVENQSRFIYLLFRLSFTILSENRWVETWKNFLSAEKLTQETLDKVLESIISDFGQDAPITSAFAMQTKNILWLRENLELLQNQSLFEVVSLMPEEHEKVDQILRDRAIAWVNYLPTNTQNYEDLSKFLHSWALTLGTSDYLDEVLAQIRYIHGKKKALISLINDLK